MPTESRTYSAVRVIGQIWQPGVGTCAMEYSLDGPAVKGYMDALDLTEREAVHHWLVLGHAGDFQSIDDFSYSIGSQPWSAWEKGEESEFAFCDAMYPADCE